MKTILEQKSWFSSWFDSSYYHQLYRHHDNKEAEKFIDALLIELEPEKNSVMLDLGCGTGRHSKHLASKGYRVTGIDLAASSIREARKFESESLHFFKRDMRMPFGKNIFNYVFSFFTSFGYFTNREENNGVVKNMAAALKEDGVVLIDYLNVLYTEDNLIPVEEKEIDGVWYHINRWTDKRFIYKRIAIRDQYNLPAIAYTEQVEKFDLNDFRQFFEQNGLDFLAAYGDYELNEYQRETSKRMIMVAKKR
jgi:SAM-dependent methyltransferase